MALSGQSHIKFVFDDAGDPIDLFKEVFLDRIPPKKTGLPSIDFCAEAVKTIG